MRSDLDALLTAIYGLVYDFLPERRGPGAPPRISDAELIALAIAQVFIGLPNDRQFLALAPYRLGHPFAYPPKQPGYNKRLRRLVPQIAGSISYPGLQLAVLLQRDPAARLDAAALRPVARDHQALRLRRSRRLRPPPLRLALLLGFRLYLVCARDGTPIGFELAPANAPERGPRHLGAMGSSPSLDTAGAEPRRRARPGANRCRESHTNEQCGGAARPERPRVARATAAGLGSGSAVQSAHQTSEEGVLSPAVSEWGRARG